MGARVDQVQDVPTQMDLLTARRGQAFFSRALRQLQDADFDAVSSGLGSRRRLVAARVGLHARAWAEAIALADRGEEGEWTREFGDMPWSDTVEMASTLPVRALRYLSDHAAVHLNVEWRDLPRGSWDRPVKRVDGQSLVARQVPWDRAKQLWLGALELRSEARASDIPDEVVRRVVLDYLASAPAGSDVARSAGMVLKDRGLEVVRSGHASGPMIDTTTDEALELASSS